MPGTQPINLYKNNTDNKGASYGAHENYLLQRRHAVLELVRHLVPFFVTRQVSRAPAGSASARTAARRVSRSPSGPTSSRSRSGLETTLKRPIVNTRDEPHADADRYRRLHVIIGDANLAEISTYLKVGTTALVLAMIEAGFLADDLAHRRAGARAARGQPRPVADATSAAARRPQITALDLQGEYLDRARKFVDDRQGDDADEQTRDVLRPLGVGARPARRRPDAAAPSELDWAPSCACSTATASATASTGARRGCSWSTCSTPTSGRRRACTTASCRAARCSGCSTDDEVAAAVTRRRRTPARTSAASACAATGPGGRGVAGTR